MVLYGEFKISLKSCVEDSPKANIQMLIFILVIPIHVVIVLKMDIIQEAILHHAKFAKKVDIIIYIIKQSECLDSLTILYEI